MEALGESWYNLFVLKKILGVFLVCLSIIGYLLLYYLCVAIETDKMFLIIHLIGYPILIICPIGLNLYHKNKKSN